MNKLNIPGTSWFTWIGLITLVVVMLITFFNRKGQGSNLIGLAHLPLAFAYLVMMKAQTLGMAGRTFEAMVGLAIAVSMVTFIYFLLFQPSITTILALVVNVAVIDTGSQYLHQAAQLTNWTYAILVFGVVLHAIYEPQPLQYVKFKA